MHAYLYALNRYAYIWDKINKDINDNYSHIVEIQMILF